MPVGCRSLIRRVIGRCPPPGCGSSAPPRVWLVFVFFTLFTVPSRPALAHGCPALNDSPGKEGGSSGTGRGAGRGSDSQRQPRPGLQLLHQAHTWPRDCCFGGSLSSALRCPQVGEYLVCLPGEALRGRAGSQSRPQGGRLRASRALPGGLLHPPRACPPPPRRPGDQGLSGS